MEPVAHPGFAVSEIGLALRDLVHVVNLAVVDAAGMDVEVIAQVLHAHDRALEVPAGGARPPGRLPLHGPARLAEPAAPEREVRGIALALDRLDASLADALPVEQSQAAVVLAPAGIEVEAAREPVCVTLGLQDPDELDHLRHVVAGARIDGCRQDGQAPDVVHEGLGVGLGDLLHAASFAQSRDQHLVLSLVLVRGQVADVGDVHDLAHLVALPLQRPAKPVGEDVGAQVAEMRVGVDGRAAGVDADPRWMSRGEFLQPPAKRIEQQ